MATSAGTRLSPPGFVPDEQRHRRLIAQWMYEANQGHLGNVSSVTLQTATVATAVVDFRVGPNSFIGMMPTTLNAASAIASGTMFVSSRSAQGFTITHANNATNDRIFSYCVLG